jgi:hypothetical protein
VLSSFPPSSTNRISGNRPGFQAAHGRSFDIKAKPAICRRPHRYVCHGKGRSYNVISTGQVRVEYSQVLSRLTYSRRYRRSAVSGCPEYPCEYRCQTVRVAEGAISSKTGEFIRNSSGIHPGFSIICLDPPASGSKDSTERRRPGPLGERPEAPRPHGPGGGSDRGNTRCVDRHGPGRRKRRLGVSHPPFWRSPRKADAALESSRHHSHE